jgi:tRNA/tmRNA/rRNA uracil-C5-methylase (TrmA/RlmC/RlmD family)
MNLPLFFACCPAALLRDVKQLTPTHTVDRFAFFDHFP